MSLYKNELIEKLIETILSERSDGDAPKSKINAKGAFGSGSWSSEIGTMQTRASTDPKGLMKDLGIKSSSGATDAEKCANVLNQAIKNNKTMGEAFKKPEKKQIIKNEKTFKGYGIAPNSEQLTYRLAAKYICLTLTAAENSGILQLTNGINFAARSTSEIPTFY